MTNKEKITDIQYLINEFYSTQESRGELNEHSKASRKLFNQYCKDIGNDLEILKMLKKHIRNATAWIGGIHGEKCETFDIDLCDNENPEEFKRIKEWLNDK